MKVEIFMLIEALHVVASEAAADETTLKLAIDSIIPPYTILLTISNDLELGDWMTVSGILTSVRKTSVIGKIGGTTGGVSPT